MVDRILNHVATAMTSKIMRVYNKSELFEPRKRVMRDWAEMIECEMIAQGATREAAPRFNSLPGIVLQNAIQ